MTDSTSPVIGRAVCGCGPRRPMASPQIPRPTPTSAKISPGIEPQMGIHPIRMAMQPPMTAMMAGALEPDWW